MKLITGESNLYTIINYVLEKYPDEIKEFEYSYIRNRIKPYFIELICSQIFTFYCKKDGIRASAVEENFSKFSNIIVEVNELEVLFILSKIEPIYLKKYTVNWAIFELNLDVDNEDYKAIRYLKLASFMDYYREKTDPEKSISYRIDLANLETKMIKSSSNISNFVKKYKKNFFNLLFNLQQQSLKNNTIKYVEQELIATKINDIEIDKEDYKNVFNYRCLVCGNRKKVILSKSLRGLKNKGNGSEYTRVNENFISKKSQGKYEIKCTHYATMYEKIEKNFVFKLESHCDEELELDKVFIYAFYTFKYDEENHTV